MSDAIENMDQMTMNLKSRQEAQQAAQKIQSVYDKYNRLALYEKAKKYQDICSDIEAADREQKKRRTDIAESEKKLLHYSTSIKRCRQSMMQWRKKRNP